MENNRSKFESHGYLINGIAEKLEIQISQSGDAARYQFRQKTLFNQLYA